MSSVHSAYSPTVAYFVGLCKTWNSICTPGIFEQPVSDAAHTGYSTRRDTGLGTLLVPAEVGLELALAEPDPGRRDLDQLIGFDPVQSAIQDHLLWWGQP